MFDTWMVMIILSSTIYADSFGYIDVEIFSLTTYWSEVISHLLSI